MVNEGEVVLPEIHERPIGFWHFVTSPFCEGESQILKLPLMALFTQQTPIFGFVCSNKRVRIKFSKNLTKSLRRLSG
jgi:hypothetical protein